MALPLEASSHFRGPDSVRSEGMFQPPGHAAVDQLSVDEHARDPLDSVQVHKGNTVVGVTNNQGLQDLALCQVFKCGTCLR